MGSIFSVLQDAVEDNEQRKKQEEAMREKLLAQEAKQQDPKVYIQEYNAPNHDKQQAQGNLVDVKRKLY